MANYNNRNDQRDPWGFAGVSNRPIPEQNAKKGIIAALTERVMKILVGRDLSTYAHSMPNTSEIGIGEASYQGFQNTAWKTHNNRRGIYFELAGMDFGDPLIHTALNIIAHCTVGYEDTAVDGFEWTMKVENKGARKILDEMKLRLELGQEVWQIARSFVCFGEEFRELVVDDEGTVRRFKHLPSYQVTPILDAYGNRDGGWEQRLDGAMQNMTKPITFQEWEVIPFIYGPRRLGWQGTGLMMPARQTHKRLMTMEDGMTMARLFRAYDKAVHRVPVKPEWDEDRQLRTIQSYMKNMTQQKGIDGNNFVFSRDNPFQVQTNIYLPEDGSKRAGVELLKSDNIQLQNIEDVLYHQSLLLCCLSVPAKYLNLFRKTGALTDAGLGAEDIQFARTLRQAQATLRGGLVRLAHYALAFQGYDSDALGVGVDLPKISADDQFQNAKIGLTDAQACDLFAQILGGLPQELVADKYMNLSDDEKVILFDFLKKQEAEQAARDKEMAKQMGANGGQLNGNGATSFGGPQTSTRKGANGRFRNPDAGANGNGKVVSTTPQDMEGVSVKEVAQVLTKLQILAQNELQERGIRFNVGYEERLHQTETALLEQIA